MKSRFGLIAAVLAAAIAAALGYYFLSTKTQPGKSAVMSQQTPAPTPAISPARLDIHFVATPHEVVKRMLELAKVGPNDIHYDLGSGDGRIVIAAVRDFNAKKAVGIDLDPKRIQESNENKAKARVGDNVIFRNENIFETDLREATTVSMYLLNTINIRMRPKLLKELKPGARIVTHAFTMGEWKAEHEESVNGYQVYLFIVPANVTGNWQMAAGETKIALELKSEFTDVSGSATVNGKPAAFRDAKVTGADIEFTIEADGKAVTYKGTVDGSTMTGASPVKWAANKT